MPRLISFVVLAAFVLTWIGCSEEKSPTDTQKDTALSTPGQTLHQLELCWTKASDVGEYSAMLVKDGTYSFYFDPNNVGSIVGGYQIPELWTRAEDIESVEKMFSQAYKIELTIINWQNFNQDIAEDIYTAENCIFQLYLYPDDEQFAYLVSGPCDIDFVKMDGKWLIRSWRDTTNQMSNETTSLGVLRAMYPPETK
jgi:hypothetical protein